jgi:hypothetical protein
LNPEFSASRDEVLIKPLKTAYERDPVHCSHYCPIKERRVDYAQHIAEVAPTLGDIIFEKPGNLIKFSQLPQSGMLKVYREWIIFEFTTRSRRIATQTVTHIWPRKRKNCGIEIMTDSGTSFLFDFLNFDITQLQKYCRRANFENCLVWPRADLFDLWKFDEKWISMRISNFEYILLLNFMAGRSFHDLSECPFLPALLADFDRYTTVTPSHMNRGPLDLVIDPKLKVRQAFSRRCVAADFFFRVELIDEVPKWALSAADFIHKLRGLIECPQVSSMLHSWISLYFNPQGLALNGRVFK